MKKIGMSSMFGLRHFGIGILLGALLSASPLSAWAAPVSFESNSYEYIEVSDPYTGNNNAWATVSAAASASVFRGVSGHLATISSLAENDFLWYLAGGPQSWVGAWLGGKHPEGWLVGPEAGQSFSYTNWNTVSEPNNNGYAYMDLRMGKWGDDSYVQGVPEPGRDPVIGYFVEYEGTASVPVPASVILLCSAMAGIVTLKKNFKKG